MNLALIGPGAMGEEHVQSFARLGGVTPYLVAGPDPAGLAAFADRYAFQHTTHDPLMAVADPGVDVVVIASPNAVHAEQARAALAAGKHLLLEIPLAMSLAEAEQLAELAAASDVVAMAGYISRYYPPIRALKRRVDDGSLAVRHLICALGTDKRENRNWQGQERDWVDDLLWHHGMHVLDVVLQLLPDDALETANLAAGARHPEHGGVMDLSVTLRFASGALATVALTYHAAGQFTRYTLVADELFVELAQDGAEGGRTDLTRGLPFADLVDAQATDFLAACRGGLPSPTPFGSVLPAMRLVDDLHTRYLSARMETT